MRQEPRQRVLSRLRTRLIETIDHDHQPPRRAELLRHPAEQLGEPSLGLRPGIALLGELRLDLRRERGGDPLGLIPVDHLAPDEVMRHRSAGGLAPVEPLRQDGALAHAGPARDHDPPRVVRPEQPLVELGQHIIAPDEPAVSPPFEREVDHLRCRR
jgi:hypothetical protein